MRQIRKFSALSSGSWNPRLMGLGRRIGSDFLKRVLTNSAASHWGQAPAELLGPLSNFFGEKPKDWPRKEANLEDPRRIAAKPPLALTADVSRRYFTPLPVPNLAKSKLETVTKGRNQRILKIWLLICDWETQLQRVRAPSRPLKVRIGSATSFRTTHVSAGEDNPRKYRPRVRVLKTNFFNL